MALLSAGDSLARAPISPINAGPLRHGFVTRQAEMVAARTPGDVKLPAELELGHGRVRPLPNRSPRILRSWPGQCRRAPCGGYKR